MAFTKIISKKHHKALYSPIVILALILFLSGLISAYPDRICYPLSTGPLCFNSTSISGLTLSGIDYYNKSEIDEQQLAQNVTLSGYYNNLSNFTGSMEASKYCVYNGSAIECNATGASGISWISFNTSGLLGGNITSSGTVGLNLSYLNVLYNDSVLISTFNNVTAQNVTAWGFFNNVANSSFVINAQNITTWGFYNNVANSSFIINDSNVTGWGFYNSPLNSSFIINSANISSWGYYYNLSNITGTLIANNWCTYNGSKIECNVTPVTGGFGMTASNVSGWGFWNNITNLSGTLNSGQWCAYNGTHIVCNVTPVVQVTGASGGITSANISGWGFHIDNQVAGLNLTSNVTFQNLTVTSNTSLWNLSVSQNASIRGNLSVGNISGNQSAFTRSCLAGTCINAWSEINVSGGLTSSSNVTAWGFWNNITNLSGTLNSGQWCAYNGTHIVCNVTPVTQVSGAAGSITSANISSWGFYYSESNLTDLLDNNYLGIGSDWVNITGDTMTGNLTVNANLTVGSGDDVIFNSALAGNMLKWDSNYGANSDGSLVFNVSQSPVRAWNAVMPGITFIPPADVRGQLTAGLYLNLENNDPAGNRLDLGWGGDGGGNFELYSKYHDVRPGEFRIIYGGNATIGHIQFTHYNGTATGWLVNSGVNENGRFMVGYRGFYFPGKGGSVTSALAYPFQVFNEGVDEVFHVTVGGDIQADGGINVSDSLNGSSVCIDASCIDTWAEVNGTSFIINQVNVSGWGFYYSLSNITGLAIYSNLSNFTGSMIADNWCAYNGSRIECNITPVTQVSGASGGISSANISGYGFKQFDNVLNITGNVTFENLTIMRNLSAGNITVNGSGYFSLGGVRVLSWAEINQSSLVNNITSLNVSLWGFQQFNQNLNTTNNVTFNNVTFTGGFINASSSKWKIGNYESNGNFSGTCYNGSVVYIGSNYALSTVGC